jgi:hypothetical protein
MLDVNFVRDVVTRANVYKNSSETFMEGKDYICANPKAINEGYPRTVQECEARFFENYDGITLKPEECEPSNCELQDFYKNIKLCEGISSELGASYLGCLLIDPNAPYCCDCPKQGKDFSKLLNVTIKNSTFWKTDPVTPLFRNSLMSLMNAVKVNIRVSGTFKVSPGDIIDIYDPPNPMYQGSPSKLNGKWLVTKINHTIFKDRHHEMVLTLSAFGNAVQDNNFMDTSSSTVEPLERIQR